MRVFRLSRWVLLKWPSTVLLQRFRVHNNIRIQKVNVQKWKVFRTKWWQLFPEFTWSSFNHALYVDYYSTFSAQTPWDESVGRFFRPVRLACDTQDKFNSRLRCFLNSQCAGTYYCCSLISAAHSPYRSVYTGLSFLVRSHFCCTLSLPQCTHRSLFLVSACYLFQKLRYSCFSTVVKFLQ
jgi:hypothetical protein